jgi:hypothetical protein
MRRLPIVLFFLLAVLYPAQAQKSNAPSPAEVTAQVRAYSQTHEHAIIKELVELLSIPNTANDAPNIQRNAVKLVAMLEQRGLRALGHFWRGIEIYAALLAGLEW